MGFDRTDYKCHKCGKWCSGIIAYRKHIDSEACRKAQEKKAKKGGQQ